MRSKRRLRHHYEAGYMGPQELQRDITVKAQNAAVTLGGLHGFATR